MDKLIAKIYGKAFFELALEQDKLDDYEKYTKIILETISNKDFIKLISHPEISQKNKMDILKNTFQENIPDTFFGFFEVLLNKKREKYIINILKEILKKIDDYRETIKVEIISSKTLNDIQLDNIRDKLSKKLNKKVVLETNIDTSFIAGIKIKICDHVIDGTVKKQIDDMKNILYNIKIA